MRRLVPTLTAGVVIGVVEVVLASSFAALIFSGAASVHVPAGIALTLFAGIVILTVTSLFSSIRGIVGSIQDNPSAVLALIAASITAQLPGARHETFLTIVAAIAISGLVTGGVFLLLGRFGAGDLVRFVPYPVVGGFLAGTGWLLLKGGAGVLTDRSLTLASISEFAQGPLIIKWVPGLAFAIVVLVLLRRSGHFLILPGAVVAGVVGFYVALAVSGTSIAEAESIGWFLGPFPEGAGLWEPWAAESITGADWSVLGGEILNILTLVLVTVLALLLNATGVELSMGEDADLNKELRTAGLANLAAGAAGGIIGYLSPSLTSLAQRTGAKSRLVGPVAAVVCGVALLLGTAVLSFFPRMLLGGIVVLLGLAFLVEWVFDAWFKLPRRDYFVVLIILLVVGFVGFLQGVGVGLVLALVLFAVDYSRTNVVKHALTGGTYRSKVERGPRQRESLRRRGERIHVLELQGFVFFGTANSLLDRIRARAQDPRLPALLCLVLDFRSVIGLDSSAVLSFTKARLLARSKGFTLVLTGLGETTRRQLERGGVAEGDAVRIFPDLDRGMQWCEDQLLARARTSETRPVRSLAKLLRESVGRPVPAGRLMGYLELIEVNEGQELIRQGAPSEDVYFLVSGLLTAQLRRRDGAVVRLRTMSPGTVVGEVTMYTGTASASVIGEVPSRIYRLSGRAMKEMERRDPELASTLHRFFATHLAQRLSEATQTMDALLD